MLQLWGKGALELQCPNPRGSGGRGGSRGGRGGGRGLGRGGPRANVATSEETSTITLTGEQVNSGNNGRRENLLRDPLHLMDAPPTTSVTFPTTPTWAKVLRHRHLHLHVGIT
jgi:hypothetical protein